jgi:hypothetical protein
MPGAPLEASIGADGWECADAHFLAYLEQLYPPSTTPAGWPWIRAFWNAVEGLGAEVVAVPEPEAHDPNTIH